MSKIATLTKYNAPVLSKRRFQRLLEIENSSSNDIQLDDINITFSGPEYGWLDVKIEIGTQVFEYSISQVYEPFKELNHWFEDVLFNEPHTGIFQFDCEGEYIQFCCDFLGYWEQKKSNLHVALFTICCDFEDAHLIMGVLAIEDFVQAFYYGLRDYFNEHKELFVEYWSEQDSDEVDLDRLEGDLTSVDIEKHLPTYNNVTT